MVASSTVSNPNASTVRPQSIVSATDGTLWVLSEASSRIVQLDRDGRELRSFRLPIDTKTFQPEGITLGPTGKIIMVGEPNILAIYETP